MTLVRTAKAVWKNRRHFKLQIFGVTVLLVVTIFLANFASISISYNNKLNDYVASTVTYTTNFQMSLSGVKGTVEKIYIDSTKTQCFILANFSGTSSLTMNANNYQMFVSNVNRDAIYQGTPKEQLAGEIYMFGTSGLVGLYLTSDIPFENQLKQLTFRSYSKFTENTSPYINTSSTDSQYDQCHIFFNPGGSDSKSIDFLEKHVKGVDFDLPEIYRQVSAVSEEIEIRTKILKFYDDLQVVMKQIVEYQNRLKTNYNVEVPALPDYIRGDYFDNIPIYGSDGTVVNEYKKYIPASILPGGTEFDWYIGSISKGYYNLIPNAKDISVRDYIYALSADSVNRRYTYESIKEWYYTDGTEVRMDTDRTTTSYETEIINTAKKYDKLLAEYIQLKRTYQVEYLPSLLLLEANSGTVGQSYTVRKDENAVLVY